MVSASYVNPKFSLTLFSPLEIEGTTLTLLWGYFTPILLPILLLTFVYLKTHFPALHYELWLIPTTVFSYESICLHTNTLFWLYWDQYPGKTYIKHTMCILFSSSLSILICVSLCLFINFGNVKKTLILLLLFPFKAKKLKLAIICCVRQIYNLNLKPPAPKVHLVSYFCVSLASHRTQWFQTCFNFN